MDEKVRRCLVHAQAVADVVVPNIVANVAAIGLRYDRLPSLRLRRTEMQQQRAAVVLPDAAQRTRHGVRAGQKHGGAGAEGGRLGWSAD